MNCHFKSQVDFSQDLQSALELATANLSRKWAKCPLIASIWPVWSMNFLYSCHVPMEVDSCSHLHVMWWWLEDVKSEWMCHLCLGIFLFWWRWWRLFPCSGTTGGGGDGSGDGDGYGGEVDLVVVVVAWWLFTLHFDHLKKRQENARKNVTHKNK